MTIRVAGLLLGLAGLAGSALAGDETPRAVVFRAPIDGNDDERTLSVRDSIFVTALLDSSWAERATTAEDWRHRIGSLRPEERATTDALRSESYSVFVVPLPSGETLLVGVKGVAIADDATRVRGLERDVDFPVADEHLALAKALAASIRRVHRLSDVVVASMDADRIDGSCSTAQATARAFALHLESSPHPHRIVAQCAARAGRIQRAVEAWKSAVARDGEDAHLHYELGRALSAAGEAVAAAASFERARACRLDDDDPLRQRIDAELAAIAKRRDAEERRRREWSDARAEIRRLERRVADRQRELAQGVAEDASEETVLARAETLLEARLPSAAIRLLSSRREKSRETLLALARALLIARRSSEALELVERRLGETEDAAALVLAGDCDMAAASTTWDAARWTDLGVNGGPEKLESYLRLRPPSTGETRARWDRAGSRYARALELAPLDGRALARRADWLLASGLVADARRLVDRGIDSETVPDVYRVSACVHRLEGDTARATRSMDTFLARRARTAAEFIAAIDRLERRGGEPFRSMALELADAGVARHPEHVGLVRRRARLRFVASRLEGAAADTRLALAAGESAETELRERWGQQALGPRSVRPTERPLVLDRRALLPGAPYFVTELVELRMLLAEALLKLGDDRVHDALAESRAAEWFLEREETRLRSTRSRERAESTGEVEWTRPDDPTDEPVDFGNVRHRVFWSRVRTLFGECWRRAGDVDRARTKLRWAARVVAVRDGEVLPESSWAAGLTEHERRASAAAITRLIEVDPERADGLRRLRAALGR